MGDREQELNNILRAYREACEISEPGRDFMPRLWERIESRRSISRGVEWLARVFTSAALATAVAAALVVSLIPSKNSDDTWVEEIANQSLAQNAAYYEPVHLLPLGGSPSEGSFR